MVIAGIMTLLFSAAAAFAADDGKSWRSTYDMALLWVNFSLFVFIIIKFARAPLKIFLQGQKQTIERKIKALEEEKAAADQILLNMSQKMEENTARFVELKNRIVDQGEKKKQEIIEDAKLQSSMMIEAARLKIDHQLHQAKQQLKSELVDAAVDLALERIPAIISSEDNQKLIQHYLTRALPKKIH